MKIAPFSNVHYILSCQKWQCKNSFDNISQRQIFAASFISFLLEPECKTHKRVKQLNLKQSTLGVKVPILKECHFGKMKLWPVDHFHNKFVLTFGRDCYCIQQSRPKSEDKYVVKVVNLSEFHFSKVTFFQNWYFSRVIISEIRSTIIHL